MNGFSFLYRISKTMQPEGPVVILLAFLSGLAACANQLPAPVQERSAPAASAPKVTTASALGGKAAVVTGDPREAFYTVKAGDTLYSIALEHGQYYRDVATWNNLEDASVIKIGQTLRILPPSAATATEGDSAAVVTMPVKLETVQGRVLSESGQPAPTSNSSNNATANSLTHKEEPKGDKVTYSDQAYARLGGVPVANTAVTPPTPPTPIAAKPAEINKPETKIDGHAWAWPAVGKVIEPFNESRNKGLDIAGKNGEAVQAVGDGRVVYSGNGLRGYGNLVVVRHNADYSSVYAHNQKILVTEGQEVKRGQKIAEMGATDADQPKLHFEVRYQGKPVDPVKFLPER